jgi:hypothetical protein
MGLCKECAAWQLGACRNLDYCLEERTVLIEQASRLATDRGHTLAAFERQTAGHSIFEAVCERCGQSVCIDMNPGDGERELFGQAITFDCTADGAEVPTVSQPA